MEFKEWLANLPEDFPKDMSEAKAPPNHNTIIGTNQRHTIDKVHDVLQFILHAIASSERNELELSSNETSGFYHIVDVCGGALRFEVLCRSDESDSEEDSDEEETEQ